MRLRNRVLAIVALAVWFALITWAGADKAGERFFYNGKIFTGEPEHPYAEALAIRGDKIVAVGNSTEIARMADKDAEKIDLHGKMLLPGLIDSHVHAIYGGISLNSPDVGESIHTVPELAAFVADARKSGKGMHGEIMIVSGMPLPIWSKIDELNATFNTGEYENQPLYLQGSDGHTGWANRALRVRAGLTKDFISHLAEAQRKYYGVGPDMEPNGFAVDAGLGKIAYDRDGEAWQPIERSSVERDPGADPRQSRPIEERLWDELCLVQRKGRPRGTGHAKAPRQRFAFSSDTISRLRRQGLDDKDLRILFGWWDQKSFKQIGRELGISGQAAWKRWNRRIEPSIRRVNPNFSGASFRMSSLDSK